MIWAGPTPEKNLRIITDNLTGQITNKKESNNETQDSLGRYFSSLLESIGRAASKTEGELIHEYSIGEFSYQLIFAGASMSRRITPAFDHLLSNNQNAPFVKIRVWDSASTGVELPRPPFEVGKSLYGGDMWTAETGRYKLVYQAINGTLSFFDKTQNEAIYWYYDAALFPYFESGAPLRMVLNWCLGAIGYQLVHAGAVGTEYGGALLVGKGGTGKSTTAFACLDSGLKYAGDDYCVVENSTQPMAHCLYNTGKLNAEDIYRFPKLMPALQNYNRLDTEKALYFFYSHFPQLIENALPIRAILIPEISENIEPAITRASPAECFLALAPSTMFQLRGADHPVHKNISDLVKNVPGYKMELGKDINQIPGLVGSLIKEEAGL